MKTNIIKYLLILTIFTSVCNSDDFKDQNPAWKVKVGDWVFEKGVLTQTSIKDVFPLILFEKQKFSTVDISVDFKPISGRIDASGGIVFRAVDKDNYFIVRANSLEDNYRLYTFKNGVRTQIASATVDAPAIGKFHSMRVVANGDASTTSCSDANSCSKWS